MSSFRTFEIIKKNAVATFLSNIMQCKEDIFEIWIVSPWVSIIEKWKDVYDTFDSTFESFLKKIKKQKINVTIVTRPPSSATEKKFIQRFEEIETARIIFLQSLHAKIYICENKTMNFAMIGSPNFTMGSFTNLEIGLLINAIKEGKRLIEELIETCYQITTLDGHIYHKRRITNIKTI
ncbi:MAG: phospholipase D-like domain-containing protein [Candidatus Heimdallarchaeaceae archaeon]